MANLPRREEGNYKLCIYLLCDNAFYRISTDEFDKPTLPQDVSTDSLSGSEHSNSVSLHSG